MRKGVFVVVEVDDEEEEGFIDSSDDGIEVGSAIEILRSPVPILNPTLMPKAASFIKQIKF